LETFWTRTTAESKTIARDQPEKQARATDP
jgi:hypothetical protein